MILKYISLFVNTTITILYIKLLLLRFAVKYHVKNSDIFIITTTERTASDCQKLNLICEK